MKPVPFKEANSEIAKDQDEYQTLPAYVDKADSQWPVVSCWELSDEEIEKLKQTKRLWLSCWTFGSPLQPLLPTVNKADVIPGVEEDVSGSLCLRGSSAAEDISRKGAEAQSVPSAWLSGVIDVCPKTGEPQQIIKIEGSESGRPRMVLFTRGESTAWAHEIHSEELDPEDPIGSFQGLENSEPQEGANGAEVQEVGKTVCADGHELPPDVEGGAE